MQEKIPEKMHPRGISDMERHRSTYQVRIRITTLDPLNGYSILAEEEGCHVMLWKREIKGKVISVLNFMP